MQPGSENKFDIAIAGGGLAGLTLAITLADLGFNCALFEKNRYPFHRVCGEYIAQESWDFLIRCGVPLEDMDLPKISRLQVSSPSGKLMKHDLNPGGFGISRFHLDHELSKIAVRRGVRLYEDCRVNDISFKDDRFLISTTSGNYYSKVCAGTWGKKSNLDLRLQRSLNDQAKKDKNYVAIKYHVRIDLPADLIGLHNFEDGYCGISQIEGGRHCLCYITSAENLRRFNGNINKMEKEVLQKNPILKKYFSEAEFLFPEPIAISNIRIGCKTAVEKHVLVIGDAAGNIAPLSGNGMSMAMRSAYIASGLISEYLKGDIARNIMEQRYAAAWKQNFRNRVQASAVLQGLLKNTKLSSSAISLLKRMPFIRDAVIRSTHGEPF